MSLHFFIIILVQFLFFLFLYIRKGIQFAPTVMMTICSILFGLVFGFIFDSVFGLLGLYTYTTGSAVTGINGTGLTTGQLVLNDIFSFGIAVATMYCLLPKKIKIKKYTHKSVTSILLVVLFVLSSLGLYFVPKSIASLFLGGVAVISFGEAVALLCNENGPFLSLFRTWKFVPFITFWINCIAVGILYEFVNWFFPFWVWLPGMDYNHGVIELLVIVFGYVVVLHPIVIFWLLVQKISK